MSATGEGTGDRFRGGAVYLCRSSGALVASGSVSLADADFKIEGQTYQSYLGIYMGSADVDGDGVEDLWVSRFLDSTGEYLAGAVTLFLGSSVGDASGVITDEDADLTIYGESNMGYFGSWPTAAGDLDGDGTEDMVLGEPGPGNDGLRHGTATLFLSSGALSGLSAGSVSRDDADAEIEGEGPSEKLGEGIAALGDVDLDGKADLLFGSNNEICGGLSGTAYIALSSGLLATPSGSLSAEDADGKLCHVAAPGDLDGDGADDMLLGTYTNSSTYSYGGAARVFFGGGF